MQELKGRLLQDLDTRNAALNEKVEQLLGQAPISAVKIAKQTPRAGAERRAVGGGLSGVKGVPGVAIIGIGEPTPGSGPAALLFNALSEAAAVPPERPTWVDLLRAAEMSFEELDGLLLRARVAIICPDLGDEDRRAILAEREGLKACVASFPPSLSKVLLLSRVGAQAIKGGINMRALFGLGYAGTFAGLEDELTSSARRRGRIHPLNVVVVRAGAPVDTAGGGGRRGPAFAVRCLRGDTNDVRLGTSAETAAEALLQALLCSVNTNFAVLDEPLMSSMPQPPDWDEMLLPFVGPEVWRAEVEDAKRTAIFVQQWAKEWFNDASGQGSTRLGLKTPVQFENTPTGVMFKFRPLGTLSGRQFDDLEEGGLEFVAEEPPGASPRLRIRRCAYGFKVITKENSERVVLQKFKEDWAVARL